MFESLPNLPNPLGKRRAEPRTAERQRATDGAFGSATRSHVNQFKDENKNLCKLDEKLIITYSSKRAQKDKADRQRLVKKARKLLDEPAKIKASNKRGGKRFIQPRVKMTGSIWMKTLFPKTNALMAITLFRPVVLI